LSANFHETVRVAMREAGIEVKSGQGTVEGNIL
jgi:hypothetical protein